MEYACVTRTGVVVFEKRVELIIPEVGVRI